jgi:hypothetical protein
LKEIARIHRGIPKVFKEAAVELVGAGLGDDIHYRAGIAPDICAIQVRLDFEFAHCFDGGTQDDGQREPFVIVDTIVKKIVGAFAIAIGKNLCSGTSVIGTRTAHNRAGC